ncbi:MAG: hydroxyacylglutathione hydrolase [Parahaliea sp.]
MLSISPLPAFNDNYIWLLHDGTHAVVVDPGDAAPVQAALAAQVLQLIGIVITHHHPDHTGGLAQLLAQWSVPVFGPDNEAIAGISQALRDGDSIELLGHRCDAIAVPGHTLDHMAFFIPSVDEQPPLLFSGDTLFAGGCGRVFEGTHEQMYQALMRLAALPPQTRIFCAHEYTQANLAFARAVEPDNTELAMREQEIIARRGRQEVTLPSMLSLELQTNPFLRCNSAALQKALQQQGRLATDPEQRSAESIFATLRTWKDNF